MRARSIRRLALAALLASGAAVPSTSSTRAVDASRESAQSGMELMEALSTGFSALERALEAGDAALAPREAAALQSRRAERAKLRPELPLELGGELARHVERFGGLLEEIADLASRGRLGGASQAF